MKNDIELIISNNSKCADILRYILSSPKYVICQDTYEGGVQSIDDYKQVSVVSIIKDMENKS